MGFFGDIVDGIGDAIDSVKDFGEDVVDFVGDLASGPIGSLASIGIGIFTGQPALIAGGVGGLFASQQAVQGQVSGSVGGPLNITLDISSLIQGLPKALTDAVRDITDDLEFRVLANITDITADKLGDFGEFAQKVFGQSLDTQTAAIVATNELEQTLFREMLDFIDEAGLEQSKLGRLVGEHLEDLAGGIAGNIGELARSAAEGIADLVTGADEIHDAIQEEARDLLRAQSESAGSLADSVSEVAEGIAAQVEAQKEALMGALSEHVGKPLGELGDKVWEGATGLLAGVVGDDDGFLERGIKAAGTGALCGSDLTGDLGQLADKFLPENKIVRWALNLLIAAFTWMSIFGGITSAQAQTVLQEYGLRCPYKVLSPPDAILAHFRGQISREEMFTVIRKDGFSETDAQNMWVSSLQIPNEIDLLAMWLRGIVSEPEFRDAMQHRGWGPDWTTKMQASARLIPPVQDLITMAVREVFDPAIVNRFGQGEDFPPEFAFWAEQQGLTEDWARKYWAAHWGLPSVQMGYEMLHRGVIDKDTLELLLRAQDVMPFWRQPLIDISFANYTRVDIRRMHKLGVLSTEEVTRAYKDIGYDEEKAANLTRFTVQLNTPPPTRDVKTLDDLTRSNILAFFKDGVIDRREATNLLRRAGFTDQVIDLLMEGAELDIEREERAAEKDLIIEQAKAGILSFDEAQDRLSGIGLETLERTKAINALVRAQAAATRLPTKADLAKFLKGAIINQAEYLDGMQRLGFSQLWAGRFHALVTAGEVNA